MNRKRVVRDWLKPGPYLKFIIIGFSFAASLHLVSGCWDVGEFENDDEYVVDKKAIKKSAEKIQVAFEKSDTTALNALMTETSKDRFSSDIETIYPFMKQFGRAFTNRKLVVATEVYARYEFKWEGEIYTVEMSIDADGNWKLMRF